MSGGYFNYLQYQLNDVVDEIEKVISQNNDTTLNKWEEPIGRGYSEETITRFKEAIGFIKKASIYIQRIDYLLEGDDGEESFHKRLQEDLGRE